MLLFFLLGCIQRILPLLPLLPLSKTQVSFFFLFRWIASNCFVCYFWLDPKVTKRSRLNRPGYSGRRLRCRLRNSLRSNNAGSGRYAFTLRFTPVRLGLSQKAPLSLMIADTACFSLPFPFPFASPFLFSLYLPFASPVGMCQNHLVPARDAGSHEN